MQYRLNFRTDALPICSNTAPFEVLPYISAAQQYIFSVIDVLFASQAYSSPYYHTFSAVPPSLFVLSYRFCTTLPFTLPFCTTLTSCATFPFVLTCLFCTTLPKFTFGGYLPSRIGRSSRIPPWPRIRVFIPSYLSLLLQSIISRELQALLFYFDKREASCITTPFFLRED